MAKIKSGASAASTPDWYDLLFEAVLEPGRLAQANKHFRQYSLANRCLAANQLFAQGVPLQPINTFKGWKAVNRVVQKGQKALALIMPVPVKAKKKKEDGTEEDEIKFTRFMLRNFWFYLGQTEGEDYNPERSEEQSWSVFSALNFLGIKDLGFRYADVSDARESYATESGIAVSAIAQHQALAWVRAAAKVLLGHCSSDPKIISAVPSDPFLREIEAEAVAFLVGATLELDGLEDSRARMQRYLHEAAKSRVPEKCVNRAFGAADKLINTGYT